MNIKFGNFILFLVIWTNVFCQRVRPAYNNYKPDTTSVYSAKYVWNQQRIKGMMDWIDYSNAGCPDSIFILDTEPIYNQLKQYCETCQNFALMDKQINDLQSKLNKVSKDSWIRSSEIELIRKSIQAGIPDDSDRLILDGMQLLDEQKPDDAYEKFVKAIGLSPTRLNYYMCGIFANLNYRKDTTSALEYLDKVISQHDGKSKLFFDPYHYRAAIYLSQDRPVSALQDIKSSIRNNPNVIKAYYLCARAREDLKDFDGSIADYQTVLKMLGNHSYRVSRDSAQILNGIGWCHYLNGNYQQCIINADKSLQINPNSSPTIDTRGSGLYGLGEYNKCITDMTTAVRLNPRSGNSWYLMGMSYLKLNKPDLACFNLSKAAELGVSEAEEAMKGLCSSDVITKIKKQRNFSAKASRKTPFKFVGILY